MKVSPPQAAAVCPHVFLGRNTQLYSTLLLSVSQGDNSPLVMKVNRRTLQAAMCLLNGTILTINGLQ
jgi:hypothetical protein